MNESMVNADLNTSVSGYQVNLVSCCNINKITVVLFSIFFWLKDSHVHCCFVCVCECVCAWV